MLKRVAQSFAVVAVTLLVSSTAFAASPVSDETFLDSLQALATAAAPETPALNALDNGPAPIAMACASQCRSCGVNKVRLCTVCNGVVSCGACEGGTVCDI